MTNVTIIGAGQIGQSLIAGLSKSGQAQITATNRRQERRSELEETYGISTTGDNCAAVKDADVVFLCVKPYQILQVAEEIAGSLPDGAVVVSMAAGIKIDSLRQALGAHPVIRVMPNTPMLVGRGMSIVSPGPDVADTAVDTVRCLLDAVGETVELAESHVNAATALSGSSPAYFYLVAEALIDAGVQLGIPREVAVKLATQAAAGAGEMLVSAGDDPATLRQKVTSPGGTTAAALRELEESGIRGAFFRAAQACADKGEELA
ncbi:pyrroline-5-carboxylate reductase [Corynebacterium phocae]|uniref:Pyrroline-5-carboxylate reductase n=1 Tax=Corynebacterium phocae TaxID=161895 RepID=A0A1L7D1B0_9CORY|nr:pyrroline-5-carboxylate reductase [Corynebacterium phocae]APT91822.1 pyrroline-5-carboxylate reductase [Corynebacterium phocae]KAA8727937.1 pyrroline-5-carboxylate reductase [Corynebacterium phocae]